MEAGIRSFDREIVALDFDGDKDARSFEVSPLTWDDVGEIDLPEDVILENMVGVAIGAWSDWEQVWHARLATRVDQSPAEPASDEYERTFLEPDDPACYPERDCGSLQTINRILKSNAAYTAWIDMYKHFRWVDVVDDHGHATGRTAAVAKVWTPEVYVGEAGNTYIYQSYAVDVWLETEDGPMRLQANWSENSLSDDPGVIRALVRSSLDDLFEATDQYIADEIAN